ncbi:hypothetical protein OSTOST_00507 [Ostertagia ostertagi]
MTSHLCIIGKKLTSGTFYSGDRLQGGRHTSEQKTRTFHRSASWNYGDETGHCEMVQRMPKVHLCITHKVNTPPLKPAFEIVGIDLLEDGLIESGNRYIVTIIDHFTSFSGPTSAKQRAETVAEVLFSQWICARRKMAGNSTLRSWNDFENAVVTALCEIMGTYVKKRLCPKLSHE